MARLRFPVPLPRRTSSRGSARRQRPIFGVGRPSGPTTSVRRSSGGLKMRLLIAAGLILFALVSYYGNPGDVNQITGERERVAMTEESQEMALGRQAKAQMVQQHGGPSRKLNAQQQVTQIGRELLAGLELWMEGKQEELGVKLRNPYEFEFTLLADPKTVNAFALPGGQVFITEALYARLDTIGQLAGVIGHEIGHVIERHGNERMAEQQLFGSIAAAGGVAGGDAQSAQIAQAVAGMIQMKYGRDDELESDKWGVRLTALSGYDPRAMIGLMKVLDEANPGGGPPEMMSTHPKPENRVAYIQQVIKAEFPNGVPSGLEP